MKRLIIGLLYGLYLRVVRLRMNLVLAAAEFFDEMHPSSCQDYPT